jgi:hypothetical protein
MAFFNFGIFGEQEHRVFNYKPRYYDPEKEAVKEKFASVDGSMEKKDYVPGSYDKGAFKRADRYRTSGDRTRMIVSLAGLLLIIVALIYIAKIYPSLVSSVDKQQKENRGIVTDEQDPDQYRIVDLNRPY